MSSSGPPKWVYPVLGLLAVGILVLGYGIYKVAAAPPPGQPVVVAPPPPPPPRPAPPVAVAPVAANPTPAAAKPASPTEAKPPSEEKAPEKARSASGKGERGHHKGSESSGKSSGESGRKGSETASSSSSSPSTSSASKSSGKKGGNSLDDLLGEVGNKKGGGEAKPAAPAVKLVTLTQSDIVNAMKGVQPRVQNCANQFRVPGTAMATISVASGGHVSSAKVTGKFAGTPTGSCVETAAKAARFPPCQGMSFPWPFTLSPR